MADIIYEQFRVFLHSLLCGFLIWCIYDGILLLRKTWHHGTFIMAVEDITFWLTAACIIFSMLYTYNFGSLRGYAFLGIFLGILLHAMCVTKPLIKAYCTALDKINRILLKLRKKLSKKQKKH